ncbi:MAG: hypothetical protein ACTSU2_17480 [Promethearchaeota archaeon]
MRKMNNPLNELADQLRETTGMKLALIDKYGFILNSDIEGFEKDKVISPTLLNFINARQNVAKELKITKIESLVLSIPDANMVFVFGGTLIILTILKKEVNISEFLNSISNIVQILEKISFEYKKEELLSFDIDSELKKMKEIIEKYGENRKSRFKNLGSIITKMNSF